MTTVDQTKPVDDTQAVKEITKTIKKEKGVPGKSIRRALCLLYKASHRDFVSMSSELEKDIIASDKLSEAIGPVENLTKDEIRFLVWLYYLLQDQRIRADNQTRISLKDDKPHNLVVWLAEMFNGLEDQIKSQLADTVKDDPLSQWAQTIYGIGPVLAAGLYAHVEIEKTPNVAKLWAFAGYAPDEKHKWKKGEKRPWNADLKKLLYKVGESFVKQKAEKCPYRRVFEQRKAMENSKNDALCFADQAKVGLEKRIKKGTTAFQEYSKGKLPPGHIHARARRYTVKMFLAHYYEVGRKMRGLPCPDPYPLIKLRHKGHTTKIEPPNWDGSKVITSSEVKEGEEE